jgi:hypothetical protein
MQRFCFLLLIWSNDLVIPSLLSMVLEGRVEGEEGWREKCIGILSRESTGVLRAAT